MNKWTAVLAVLPNIVMAEDWTRLTENEAVIEALADRVVVYDAYTTQSFGRGGDTQFVTERVSRGRWAAQDGQYCSLWPPSDTWTCYDLDIDGDRLRFVASDGSVSEGAYRK